MPASRIAMRNPRFVITVTATVSTPSASAQIATIWSRARMPARAAGVPSIGETTSM